MFLTTAAAPMALLVAACATPALAQTSNRTGADQPTTLDEVIVTGAHQGRGLGKAIVSALVAHLRGTAADGVYVRLMAGGEAHELYAQFGFELTAPRSVGRAFVVNPVARRTV